LTVFNDNPVGNANCYRPNGGEVGVTIWGPRASNENIYLEPYKWWNPNSSTWIGYFTFTQPSCYQQGTYGGTTVCNLSYTLAIDRSASADDVGPIEYYLGNFNNGQFDFYLQSPRYHSKTQDHDITETHDISQSKDGSNNKILRDNVSGWQNYAIKFVNMDTQVGVYIKGLTMIRAYKMCGMATVLADECCAGEGGCPSQICRDSQTFQQQSDFANRVDAPCNYDNNCDNLSTTFWDYDDHVKKVDSGQEVTWEWSNPADSFNNYVGSKSCLFNFNNTVLNAQTPSNINDVQFSIKVNNSDWVDFYHTKKAGNHMAPSVDLATHSVLSASNGYDDHPNATNVLHFKVQPNNDTVGLALCDGSDTACQNNDTSFCCRTTGATSNNVGGKVNIYRTYRTVKLYEQKTITVTQTSNGTISAIPPSITNPWTYTDASFAITPQSGYAISHVYVDSVDQGAITSYTFHSVTANHSIIAWFVPTYTITTSSLYMGSISPSGPITVTQGDNQGFTITACNCYQISDVVIDGTTHLGPQTSPFEYTFTNVQSNHTLIATFNVASEEYAPVILDVQGVAVTPPQVTFVIDGTENYSPSSVACESLGEHSFSVDATTSDVYGNYTFQYFDILDGGANHLYYVYDNPATIDVSSSTEFVIATYSMDS
jgi:hypothetical protein